MHRIVLGIVLASVMVWTGEAIGVDIIWDGGDGAWNSNHWNGGQTAQAVFGRTNGLEVGGSEIGTDVYITSGNVIYDPNTYGDFRYKNGGTLNLSGGATFSMDTTDDTSDGYWTEFDGDALNIDNATFRRGFVPGQGAGSGGAIMFGSWRSYINQVIRVNITSGGLFENDGQLWFGSWEDHEPGLTVIMTINNGAIDLTGGNNVPLGEDNDADWVIAYGRDDQGNLKNETYAVNFTGPGSITVDSSGIIVAEKDEMGDWQGIYTLLSYQDLWNRGILQAHGWSGLQGAKFNGFFSVTGTVAMDDYKLTSNAKPQVPIIWDGGDGAWNSNNWNGGQDAAAVFGRTNGLEIGSGEIGTDVYINSGNVTYDPNTRGDFRYRSGGTLNLSGGATFSMDTTKSQDEESGGYWTEFDGDAINIDNATFRRGYTPETGAITGGVMTIGSWRSYDNQRIEVNLTGGGRLENDGQLWFGAPGDNGLGLNVVMTINNGYVDLTGGSNFAQENDGENWTADLLFAYGWDADAGTPAGEEYAINFTGPGTITVDEAGIIIAEKDASSFWNGGYTVRTYQELWNRGILRAHGRSGLQGVNFNSFFTVTGSEGAANYMLTSKVQPLVPIVWDGGDGAWNSNNWNGGQGTAAVFGRSNGLEIGSGEIGTDVYINSGNVTYDPNTNGDFRFKCGGTLNLSGGATFSMDTTKSQEEESGGYWTEFDGDAININNATFRRGFTPETGAITGGVMTVGSWRSFDNQRIEINISGGGRFENDGQLWFGAPGDNAPGLAVIMTISNGHVDLTGGDNFAQENDSRDWTADLLLAYGWDADAGAPAGEEYVINFTGPGTFTVDQAGIIVTHKDASGWQETDFIRSYSELWDMGILQANGLSGLDGATFGDYFTVVGIEGSDDYILTSLLTAPENADFDGDGDVDGADFLAWQAGFGTTGGATHAQGDANNDGNVNATDLGIWKTQFGTAGAGTSLSAIPEPAAFVTALLCILGLAYSLPRKK